MLAAFERLKKFPLSYNGENLVSALEPSFLIQSFSFLQVTMSTIKAWMSLNFCIISPMTTELAALKRLKKKTYNLVSNQVPSFLSDLLHSCR